MFFNPILFSLGILLFFFGIILLIPGLTCFISSHPGSIGFFQTALLTSFIGITLVFLTKNSQRNVMVMNDRQTLFLVVAVWAIISFISAVPFYFSLSDIGFADAFFEAVSGLTTTGSTVLTNLDSMPSGILVWRSLLQWIGGIGVVVMAAVILPSLQVGGMQLFRIEFAESAEKALPRTAQFVAWISAIYVSFTLLCSLLYWLAGMSGFDAINHAMTTLATGGFSTHDRSFAHFNNSTIDLIGMIFMILGSLPFVLFLQFLLGRPQKLIDDEQVLWFFRIFLSLGFFIGLVLWINSAQPFFSALRYSFFNVISIMTGTGYTNSAYDSWASWAMPVFLFIMMLGGCAGSTSCGVKIFRIIVLAKIVVLQFKSLLQPHGVFVAYFNNKSITQRIRDSVLSFFIIFIFSIIFLSIGLSITGLDFVSAMSSAVTALTNVGPALGPVVGPSSTFQSLTDSAKWMMSFGMLLGRLEFFAILVLFVPAFWKK